MTAISGTPPYIILTDFDGTAAETDVQQVILDALADHDAWRRINSDWAAGKMTTAQRATQQWGLIAAPEHEVLTVLETLRLDPWFPAFARLCADRAYPLYVVSDGFDFYIRPLMERAGLGHLPVIANSLQYRDGAPQMTFLHQRSPDQYYANDKTFVIEQLRQPGSTLVYIGDGYSDRAAAHVADLLFAKERLADYCREEHIPFLPIETFADVVAYFEHQAHAGTVAAPDVTT